MVKKMIAMLVALMVMSGVAMSAFADGDVTDVQSPAETVEQVVGETPA